MKTREEIVFDYRVNDLYRVYPDTPPEFRAHILKMMGDVDSLGYAQEFIRLKEQNALLKAYMETNSIDEQAAETDVDITARILQRKYEKQPLIEDAGQ